MNPACFLCTILNMVDYGKNNDWDTRPLGMFSIKQIENNNQFARELKKLLIKGCYYSIQEYLNEEFSTIRY
jgi:hypothetical protein